MTKSTDELIYGLTPLQRNWSRFKLRHVLNSGWVARKAKNYFYAELLRRRHA